MAGVPNFSIPAQDLYRDSVNVFPKGSPYHRLREYRSDSIPNNRSHSSVEENYFHCENINSRRRPMSAHINDDTFLAWSADTIVRRRIITCFFFVFLYFGFVLVFFLIFFVKLF